MPDLFLAPGPPPRAPTEQDIEYGTAFALVAQLLDASTRSEELALRLSTCRNAFLTINGLFATLRKALGRGSRPSPAARAIFNLRRNEPDAANRDVDELRETLAIAAQKWRVWRDRESLDQEFKRLVHSKEAGLKPHEQARVEAIPNDVIDVEKGHDGRPRKINRAYLEISTEEPPSLTNEFSRLREVDHGLQAIADIGRAIANFLRLAPELMAKEGYLPGVSESVDRDLRAAAWGEITKKLLLWENVLLIRNDPKGGAFHLRYPKTRPIDFEHVPKDWSDARSMTSALLDHLAEIEERIYDDLSRFRPNSGPEPMPSTFEIDLTPPPQIRVNRLTCKIDTVSLERHDHKDIVRIAMPSFRWPQAAYHGPNEFRFAEAHLPEIECAIEAALTAAINLKADAIVFPEYFVPECCVGRCAASAKNGNILFIGGQEGTHSKSNRYLENIAVVAGPGLPVPKKQFKHYRSVNEPINFTSESKQYIFTNTQIGTFSVVVCSDCFEHHIVDAIASVDPMVDIIFLCGFNPGFDGLFHHLAITDATRLFTHVVVANNASGKDQASISAAGSGAYFPTRDFSSQPLKPAETHKLPVPDVFAQEMNLHIYNLSIADVAASRDRDKPLPHLLAVPNFCRTFDQRVVTSDPLRQPVD
jgi:hypothetical protein